MKLFLEIKSTKEYACIISESLNAINCNTAIENETTVITMPHETIDSQENIDMSNNDSVWKLWESINNFIAIINGAIAIEKNQSNTFTLAKASYEDEDGNTKDLTSIAKGNIFFTLGSHQLLSSELVPLALKNIAVAKVLRLSNREMDWVNLYRIYEIIKEDAGIKTTPEVDRFKGSANNSFVTGDNSRHGKIKSKEPKKTMHISEAEQFIKRISRKWMTDKVNTNN